MVDPGRYTYAEGEPNLRHWFRGTAAHNTVCVDGADQTPYARGRSSLPSAEATFLGRDDATTRSRARCARPCYEAVHRRRVILVDGRYWVDRGRADGRAQPPLRPALAPRARPRCSSAPTASSRRTSTIAILGARSVALEDGWISPEYGVKHAAPVVSAVADRRRRARSSRCSRPTRTPERAGDAVYVGDDTDRARRAGDAAMSPDPAVPRRDALLRPATMAGVLSQRLHAGVPVERCERTYVKYRVGDSLRVVYRYRVGERHVRRGAQRPQRDGVPAPEVGAALFPFPHDRKLRPAALAPARRARAPARPAVHAAPRRLRRRAVRRRRVPRRAGNVIAYAKVQRDDGERRGCARSPTRTPSASRASSPTTTACSLLEALPGRRLDHLRPELTALHGSAPPLAALHDLKRRPAPRFARLDPARLATAAG